MKGNTTRLQSSAMLLSSPLLQKKKEKKRKGGTEQRQSGIGKQRVWDPAKRIKSLLYPELTKMVVPKGVALTWCKICDTTRLLSQTLLKLGASHLYVFNLEFPYIQGDEVYVHHKHIKKKKIELKYTYWEQSENMVTWNLKTPQSPHLLQKDK